MDSHGLDGNSVSSSVRQGSVRIRLTDESTDVANLSRVDLGANRSRSEPLPESEDAVAEPRFSSTLPGLGSFFCRNDSTGVDADEGTFLEVLRCEKAESSFRRFDEQTRAARFPKLARKGLRFKSY